MVSCVFINSISVISGPWEGGNERLAVCNETPLMIGKISAFSRSGIRT